MLQGEAFWIFLSCGAIGLFSFLAVAAWADARRREREAFYKGEALRKIAETQGGEAALAVIREDKAASRRKQVEGIRLGGMINIGVGLGLMIMIFELDPHDKGFLVGIIPLFIGIALMLHAYLAKE
jgi:hypothetical protein